MNFDLVWKLFSWLCKALRCLTRLKPRRGVFLIVEDNALDAELLQYRLAKCGWRSEVAPSAEVAAGLAKHSSYPAAFVDMRLPGMSGAALLRLLSRDAPQTNLVVVCGEPADLADLPDGQFVCLMRKPPSLEAIQDMLAKLKL